MKRFLFVGLVALGLAATARSAKADCAFEYSCSRHLSYVHTSKNRCFSFNSHSTPLPCMSSSGYGYSGPAWGAAPAYGYAAPVAAAPVAAAPAAPAAAPAATTPSFNAPAPKQTPSNSTAGLQQAGYFYYGQTANPGYGAGYNYSTGYSYYGYGSAGAPNYWYDN
ncbi:MAG TPA: hypothetical protein VH682_26490 [Gemmataceae bacterium]|jgi:hypothetical protein